MKNPMRRNKSIHWLLPMPNILFVLCSTSSLRSCLFLMLGLICYARKILRRVVEPCRVFGCENDMSSVRLLAFVDEVGKS